MEIQFDRKPIKDAENLAKVFDTPENYARLHITADQRQFINDIAVLLVKVVPIKEMAMRGFIIRAGKKWQMKNRKKVSESVNWGKKEKAQFGIELMDAVFQELTRMLVEQEDELELEMALVQAIEIYNNTFLN